MIMKRKNIILAIILGTAIALLSSCNKNTDITTDDTTTEKVIIISSETDTAEEMTTPEVSDEVMTVSEAEASETDAAISMENEEAKTELTTTSEATTEITTVSETEIIITEEETVVADQTEADVSETEATTPETEETTMTITEAAVEKKYIALTFDDGPNTTTTNDVLDVLEQYGIKGSFFLIGNNINPETEVVVKRAYDMGCDIENHSKSHSYMNEMTVDEIKEETDYVTEYIEKITGERPQFFRPPYIAINNTMYDNIDLTFIAGFGCNDWDDKVTADRRAKVIIRQAQDGGIILLHDAQGNSKTVEALHTIIPELQAQGYEFVTISELFEIKGVALSPDDGNLYTFVGQ